MGKAIRYSPYSRAVRDTVDDVESFHLGGRIRSFYERDGGLGSGSYYLRRNYAYHVSPEGDIRAVCEVKRCQR